MPFGPPQVVEAQPREGLPFGLFSVLRLRESSDPHWLNGVEWRAMSCEPASAIDDPDCAPEEVFFNGSWQRGEARPFWVYGSDLCGTPGGPAFRDGEENATAQLLAREEAQAEWITWGRLAAAPATDLHPSGALPRRQALALLEDWMGATYGSLGVVHGSRGAITALDTLVTTQGSQKKTVAGTPVVAGAGYPGTGPTGSSPAAGSTWLMASPALFGYRGQVQTTHALDMRKNDHYALASRGYVVGFDPCGVGAVLLDLTA